MLSALRNGSATKTSAVHAATRAKPCAYSEWNVIDPSLPEQPAACQPLPAQATGGTVHDVLADTPPQNGARQAARWIERS